MNDLPGLVGGLAGTALFMLGAAIAAGAGLRMALVLRRPEKGRLARGVAAGGGVVGVCGLGLFYGAQATRYARAFDAATPFAIGTALTLGALVAWRVARSRPAPREPVGKEPPAAG